jgi:hypothetical protein
LYKSTYGKTSPTGINQFSKPAISTVNFGNKQNGLTIYNDYTRSNEEYDYDDEEADTISNQIDNEIDKDSTKNRLTIYKSSSIHSKQVTNILKRRPIEQLGEKFKVKGGKIYLNMGETGQINSRIPKKKLIETEQFI